MDTANAQQLAIALEAWSSCIAIMPREDTIVFPAWKQTMPGKQLDEMNDKFEDIEQTAAHSNKVQKEQTLPTQYYSQLVTL